MIPLRQNRIVNNSRTCVRPNVSTDDLRPVRHLHSWKLAAALRFHERVLHWDRLDPLPETFDIQSLLRPADSRPRGSCLPESVLARIACAATNVACVKS